MNTIPSLPVNITDTKCPIINIKVNERPYLQTKVIGVLKSSNIRYRWPHRGDSLFIDCNGLSLKITFPVSFPGDPYIQVNSPGSFLTLSHPCYTVGDVAIGVERYTKFYYSLQAARKSRFKISPKLISIK